MKQAHQSLKTGSALALLLGVLTFCPGQVFAQDLNFQTMTINGVTASYNTAITPEQFAAAQAKAKQDYLTKKAEIEKAMETMKTNPHLTPQQHEYMQQDLLRQLQENERMYEQALDAINASYQAVALSAQAAHLDAQAQQNQSAQALLAAEKSRVAAELRALGVNDAGIQQAMNRIDEDWNRARTTPCNPAIVPSCPATGFLPMTSFRSAQADTLIEQVKGGIVADARNATGAPIPPSTGTGTIASSGTGGGPAAISPELYEKLEKSCQLALSKKTPTKTGKDKTKSTKKSTSTSQSRSMKNWQCKEPPAAGEYSVAPKNSWKYKVYQAYCADVKAWSQHAIDECGAILAKDNHTVYVKDQYGGFSSPDRKCAGPAPNFKDYDKGGSKYPVLPPSEVYPKRTSTLVKGVGFVKCVTKAKGEKPTCENYFGQAVDEKGRLLEFINSPDTNITCRTNANGTTCRNSKGQQVDQSGYRIGGEDELRVKVGIDPKPEPQPAPIEEELSCKTSASGTVCKNSKGEIVK